MSLYPLKFTPIAKETIWGGNKLQKELNKDFPAEKKIGESWEISGVTNDISVVANGALKGKNLNDLILEYRGQLLGEQVYQKFGKDFPLLIKFIDANDVLSIQVHPDDHLAKERHNSFGKTEMWYMLGAEKESNLIVGFNQEVDQDLYQKKLDEGKLEEILNVEQVEKGSSYFIPAGRVHAIGKGILVAEIQQTSNITYRMYDWNRTDAQGNGRELHTELALAAIDYSLEKEYETKYSDRLNQSSQLATCEYFTTNKLIFDREIKKDYSQLDSFVIYMCLDGEFGIEYSTGNINLKKGETVLIPAELKKLVLKPKGKVEMLEVYI